MRRFGPFFLALGLLLFGSSNASAASITFNLDCTFTGPTNDGNCAVDGFYGTVTLSDNAVNPSLLDIRVDMAGDWFGARLYLNVDFIPAAPYTNWVGMTPGLNPPVYNPNGVGNQYLYFDLSVLHTPGAPVDPWTGTIALTNTANPTDFFNLDPSMFAVITNDPEAGPAGTGFAPVYLSVFRQNQGATITSVVGATSVVPEPASLALLGLGLVGVAAARRRMRK